MMGIERYNSTDPIAWCPGCGNFGMLGAVKKAMDKLELAPEEVLLVSGIGQAAKLPHYVKANCFNGLHGRALPVACGARMANRRLNVIVTTGDGDCYGEGGNHLIHNIRRNPDITVVVHNNQIYGLTKGQASPTTDRDYVTPVQTKGVIEEPFHALQAAITLGVGFAARSFSGEIDHAAAMITKGVEHKGFALVEVMQPCVSFNKKNTHAWYKERIYKLEEEDEYDPGDRNAAYIRAGQWGEKIPIGVLFEEGSDSFEKRSGLLDRAPLAEEDIENIDISPMLEDFRV
ncbi:MAG: 2-oxoacid ferredoxin oxidoreductase [Candidatus Omnitrophica bacterium]|nr:2-oxoacid ferredoxin oxidoreductase [Candidatus Omnitrophota bacterium]